MIEFWRRRYRYSDRHVINLLMLLLFALCQDCWSLNDKGLALLRFREGVLSDPFGALMNWKRDNSEMNPCSWNGIHCNDGYVVSLDLKDLCLGGTLAPELGKLIHIKSINLRNNCFSGTIPVEIAKLKELELLDLGYNNFTGPLPLDLGNNLSLSILLLDNNQNIKCISHEIFELQMVSEIQTDKKLLSQATKMSTCSEKSFSRPALLLGEVTQRRLQQISAPNVPKNVRMFSPIALSPNIAPALSPNIAPIKSPSQDSSLSVMPSPAPTSIPTTAEKALKPIENFKSSGHHAMLLSMSIGGSLLLMILVVGLYFWRTSKNAVVNPWATGLSGQLQKAFVTGVPKLRRSELETACEDFSNVIGSSAVGILYKGTLSSGVEIAVMSFSTEPVKNWSNTLEGQFREKIDKLSKLNHKNFANLIGYCEEEEPFTRMMVFEYAPNGTLFEHLHIKESEHLDWNMRMRIVMGIAYCLEYMNQLAPPLVHKKLNSCAVHITEDYAAKVSDFVFWREATTSDMESSPASNVYSFGVLLFEIVTGKLPYAVESSTINDWASDYLKGNKPLTEMADPILSSIEVQHLERIGEVIRSCVNPDPKRRPSMGEVTAILREVTSIGPDRAIPRLSPLWWAELEILSAEIS